MTDIQLSGSTPDAQTLLFAKYLKLSAFGGYRIEIEHKALPDEKSVKQTTNRRGLSERLQGVSSAGCCLLLQRNHKEVCPVRGFYDTFATKSVRDICYFGKSREFVWEKKGCICRYKV